VCPLRKPLNHLPPHQPHFVILLFRVLVNVVRRQLQLGRPIVGSLPLVFFSPHPVPRLRTGDGTDTPFSTTSVFPHRRFPSPSQSSPGISGCCHDAHDRRPPNAAEVLSLFFFAGREFGLSSLIFAGSGRLKNPSFQRISLLPHAFSFCVFLEIAAPANPWTSDRVPLALLSYVLVFFSTPRSLPPTWATMYLSLFLSSLSGLFLYYIFFSASPPPSLSLFTPCASVCYGDGLSPQGLQPYRPHRHPCSGAPPCSLLSIFFFTRQVSFP